MTFPKNGDNLSPWKDIRIILQATHWKMLSYTALVFKQMWNSNGCQNLKFASELGLRNDSFELLMQATISEQNSWKSQN